MNAMFPRPHIAEQISDLRQMRNHLSDLTMTACRIMSSPEVPEEIKAEVSAAIEAAHKADQIGLCCKESGHGRKSAGDFRRDF